MTIPVPWRSSFAAAWVWVGCFAGWGAWSGSSWVVLVVAPLVALALADLRWGMVALAFVVLGLAATSAWWWHSRAPPLLALAADQQTVTVLAELTTNPEQVHTEHLGDQPQTRVVARIHEVQDSSISLRVRGTLSAYLPPAETAQWARGSQVRLSGQLGLGSKWRDPVMRMQVREAELIRPPIGGTRLLAHARERMWAALGSGDGSALVAGLAVGDDSRQTSALADAMRDSGLSHLTAVSGGKVR